MKPDPIAECAHCGKPYMRRSTLQQLCGAYRCAIGWTKARKAAERAEFKRRKEAAKPRKELMAEAQKAFNAFIRARDYGKPCICCGAEMNWASDKPGGEIDAGHFLSIGSAPHMRFIEGNVHAQRKSCNKPGGAKRHAFRAGVIARIGLAAVEVLESDQTLRKLSADDLRAIRDLYRAKAKELGWATKT